uniref:Uncharacterized protein n=1 Tax=Cajanus cajan TaxID=3821 RepID=A0A151TA80_CAJCA|nr:hypothetical protein KK1_018522 [Cajanus cajan]
MRGKLRYHFYGYGFVGVYFEWGEKMEIVKVVNVYLPCHLIDKKMLWNNLIMSKMGFGSNLWCVIRVFNVIRNSNERRGGVGGGDSQDMMEFNQLIVDMQLVDLPLVGCRFTWMRGDESMMSILDRVLVSED